MTELVSFGQRVHDLAREHPERVTLIFVPREGDARELTCLELDQASTRLANLLTERGVGVGDLVAVSLRNSPEHVLASLAIWKAGGSVLPMRWDVPEWERNRLQEATKPKLVLSLAAGRTGDGTEIIDVRSAADRPVEHMEDRVPVKPIAIPTGGSTGASKAVVMPIPGALPPGMAFAGWRAEFGVEPFHRHIVFAPLYHGNPFLMVHAGLFDGQLIILHEKFDAVQVVDSIRRYRPEFMTLAPTMMKRLLEVPGIEDIDWSPFKAILHGTAPCPEWLKRRFIELVGAERLWEVFASSELNGSIIIRGDEWLEHPGTVGRPSPTTELKILDENRHEVAHGEVGTIYMRVKGAKGPVFSYLGEDEPEVNEDGFVSVGDLGYVDEQGYVYSADRRDDLIITGGANVVPAEVEAAIGEHAGVGDVAVIGLPDEEWGKRVHAVIVPTDPEHPPSDEELRAHCKSRLAAYKVPKSFELTSELPRSDMFKIRRSALVAERTANV